MPKLEFFVPVGTNGATVTLGRGEALRALIAAIYDVAYRNSAFTTDDVFAQVHTNVCTPDQLRKATAESKLVAVALHKVQKNGHIRKTSCIHHGDEKCHRRSKSIWASNVVRT